MDKVTQEILRKFALAFLRHLLTALGLWLVKKGFIDEYTQGILTSEGFAIAIVGLIIAGGSALWQWKRAKYAVALPKAALKADPETTSLEMVKTEVKNRLYKWM